MRQVDVRTKQLRNWSIKFIVLILVRSLCGPFTAHAIYSIKYKKLVILWCYCTYILNFTLLYLYYVKLHNIYPSLYLLKKHIFAFLAVYLYTIFASELAGYMLIDDKITPKWLLISLGSMFLGTSITLCISCLPTISMIYFSGIHLKREAKTVVHANLCVTCRKKRSGSAYNFFRRLSNICYSYIMVDTV